ncbi:ribosomal protein S5 domain 2-type protein [Dichotomopilus funicola]|uniref:Ribosomal RNA-processing protein 43 n=1 Tax=Dichotomopilus funicola TaxID=1934379 RepID=A0AAN6UW63_9PEZI|nr:ribosomal protein S5 domain 2-type protein [Dichotomopilus funicola]
MTTPTIKLPAPLFAKLSPHPFLLRNLTTTSSTDSPSSSSAASKPTRTNGRAPHEPRPLHLRLSSLSHAHGSSLVRLGDTTVLCGVRGEILPVERIPGFRAIADREAAESNGTGDDNGFGGAGGEPRSGVGRGEIKDYDLLVPNIELATGSAPQFLPGVPPSTLAQTLSTRVYSLLCGTGLVDVRDLRVWRRSGPRDEGRGTGKGEEEDAEMVDVGEEGDEEEGQEEEGQEEEGQEEEDGVVAYWVLYIDLLFVSFDGNPFDAAWAAVVAALRSTKLPVARWEPEREMVVCSRTEKRSLRVRGLPVACTAVVFEEKDLGEVGAGVAEGRHWLLLDPDRLEETLCRETVTMVVDCSDGETRIKSLEKHGGTTIGRELVRGFAGIAEARWKEVDAALK